MTSSQVTGLPASLAVVTGASQGIGLGLVRQLAGPDRDVLAVCRGVSPQLAELPVEICPDTDITDPLAPERIRAQVAGRSIDTLIHNAGIFLRDEIETATADTIRQQMEVNAIAPVLLTQALLPLLATGARIALVSSGLSSLGGAEFGGHYGYRMSKAALNAFGVALAQDLRSQEMSVLIAHPGVVQTQMTNQQGEVDARTAAHQILQRLAELTPTSSGQFLHRDGTTTPW